MTVINFPDEYYEGLGEPRLAKPFTLLEAYRFDLVSRALVPGSVLDVGAFFGDFLRLARRKGHAIQGTEVNSARVAMANSALGESVVTLAFRNGLLNGFGDASADNVVCMEVLEHIGDDRLGLSELCRVARARVLITVPFQEHVQYYACVHCGRWTPQSGHLHAYGPGSLASLAPPGWRVAREWSFAKRMIQIIASRLPKDMRCMAGPLRLLDSLSPGPGRWLMAVLEPASAAATR